MAIPGKPPKPKKPSPGGRAKDDNHEKFINSLNNALATNPTVSTGRVHLIGLEKIKEMIGDDWDRLKAKAHHIVRSVINERLSSQDMCTLYGDLSYLVVFANLGMEEAQLKCSMIAQEICSRLIGNLSAPDFTDVSTLAAKEDGKLHFKESPSIETLAGQLEKASRIKKKDVPYSIAKPRYTHYIDWNKIRLIFRPLWFVRHEMVSTFLCIPVLAQESGIYLYGYQVLPSSTDPEAIAKLDAYILNRTVGEMDKIAEKGGKALLSVPVHYESLAGPRRRKDYINLCTLLLSKHQDRMVFELVELPEGIPQSRIVDLVSALRSHARAVTAKFSLSHGDFAGYRAAGLHAVGVDVYSEKRRDAEIMKMMDSFVELANKNNLKTYIHGVRTLSLKTAAITSGFDYIDGYALTSVVDSPVGAYPLDLKESYRPLIDWKGTKDKLAART